MERLRVSGVEYQLTLVVAVVVVAVILNGLLRVSYQASHNEDIKGWERKVEAMEELRSQLVTQLKESQEVVVTLEGELRTLRHALQDAKSQTTTEQLEELGRAAGEVGGFCLHLMIGGQGVERVKAVLLV